MEHVDDSQYGLSVSPLAHYLRSKYLFKLKVLQPPGAGGAKAVV